MALAPRRDKEPPDLDWHLDWNFYHQLHREMPEVDLLQSGDYSLVIPIVDAVDVHNTNIQRDILPMARDPGGAGIDFEPKVS